MRKPNHIVLDFHKYTTSNSAYWATNFTNPTFNSYSTIQLLGPKNLPTDSHNVRFYHVNRRLKKGINGANVSILSNPLYTLSNINFLRKEKLYTKLKYSRSPAFDTVSGGAAALLAGLLGFLVSEKFGMELVDSGDFYYLFMYGVFLSFSCAPLLFATQSKSSLLDILGPGSIFLFFRTGFVLFLRTLPQNTVTNLVSRLKNLL